MTVGPGDVPIEWVPPMARRLIEVAGPDSALKICRAFGGRALYLPARVTADSEIAGTVGIETAQRIVRALGSGTIEIPRARSWEICLAVLQGMTTGQSAREIALAAGCTRRRVWQVRARLRQRKAPPAARAG
jgi:hypothetical protein